MTGSPVVHIYTSIQFFFLCVCVCVCVRDRRGEGCWCLGVSVSVYLAVSVSELGNERHLDQRTGNGPQVAGIEIGILAELPESLSLRTPYLSPL